MEGRKNIQDSLGAHHLAPSKRFGQNFLVNKNTSIKIVRLGGVLPSDTIIEVGVGLGALTLPLAEAAKQVIGIEIDSGIIRFHEKQNDLPENVSLIHQDILKTDFADLHRQVGSKLKIMANLPYSISNPFLFKLVENHQLIERATIMLQKEVAERIMAKPGSKQYGIPSVLLQSRASIEKLMSVGAEQFHPRPKVDSAVVSISFWPKPPHVSKQPDYSYPILQTLVRAAFGQRRKTLINTLSSCRLFSDFLANKSEIRELTKTAIINSDIDPQVRGETLTLDQFIQMAVSFQHHLSILKKK